jgi:hypothetical protein
VSPQKQRLRSLFFDRLERVKPSRVGLPAFFLVSVLVHALLLWLFHSLSLDPRRSWPLTNIALIAGEAVFPPAGSAGGTKPPSGAVARAGKIDQNPRASRSSQGGALPRADGATAGGNSGEAGSVTTDSGGVGFAGSDPSAGGVGKQGNASGSGSGAADGRPETARAKPIPSAAERSVIAIPPAIQRTTSPYESEVYAEADFYALFTPDLRMTINVPANEVCVDGAILRTYERRVVTQRVTDIAKCRYESYGDEQERMRCPPEAHTTLVTYDNYLSSPVSYTVNVCAIYDRSSCFISPHDDGPDQESCRVRGKYDGIWAAGTMFHYPCMKFSSQSFAHSLQYEVRFIQNVEFPDARMRRRLVHRENRSLSPCQ